MIAGLLSFLPARGWLCGALAAGLAILIGWHVIHEGAQRRAAIAAAIAVADGRWQQAIAKANAEADALLQSAQARLNELAGALITSRTQLDATLARIEADNDALPSPAACGLDRDRVRLLGRL